MIPKQTRDGYPMRQGYGVLPGPADTYIGYGREWANVSNTPFREYKHWVHEGGISTPLVAHWPKGIPARGELRTQPGHLIDLMATAVDLTGAKYPADLNGQPITPMQGVSLRAAFENKPLPRAEPIFWEHEGNRAAREGDWKLVAKGPAGNWELYNLAADRTETRDLASAEPAKLKELVVKWEAWAKRAHVIPWPHLPQYGEAPGDMPTKKGKKKQ
jgi:arylsulfatase